jgi:transformation/transcription domain-associated protein
LTQFLVERLDDMGGDDSAKAGVLLRLFKLLFGAVTLFPDQNETVLQPHLSTLITRAMEMGVTSRHAIPTAYIDV